MGRRARMCVMGAHAAMKVTRPVMVIALLYFSFTDPRRSQKKMVDAIIEARVKERELYTRSNCAAFIGYIMVCEVLEREPVQHGARMSAREHHYRACKSGRIQQQLEQIFWQANTGMSGSNCSKCYS